MERLEEKRLEKCRAGAVCAESREATSLGRKGLQPVHALNGQDGRSPSVAATEPRLFRRRVRDNAPHHSNDARPGRRAGPTSEGVRRVRDNAPHHSDDARPARRAKPYHLLNGRDTRSPSVAPLVGGRSHCSGETSIKTGGTRKSAANSI